MPTTEIAYWGKILVLLLIATACGGVIGYQRETLERPAGFRTHILVCVGSAVYMLVSVAVAGSQFDPGRIAAQVASGMGFLGAGTIIKQGSIVHGLTTAASLWAVAGIGLAVGYGGNALVVAILGTLVVLLALATLRGIERGKNRIQHCSLSITMGDPRGKLDDVRRSLTAQGLEIRGISLQYEHGQPSGINVDARAATRQVVEQAASVLIKEMHADGVDWYCEP